MLWIRRHCNCIKNSEAKMSFQRKKSVLTNKFISVQTRRKALECYIEPILIYGYETWTISKRATEKWFLRKMLRISWTARKSNETVLREAGATGSLVNRIRKCQVTCFGHMMRSEKLKHLVTTEMIEGKRSRVKRRKKLLG